jgi:hypothetical protein
MRTDSAYFLVGAVFCAAILAGSIRSDAMVMIIAALSVMLLVMAISFKSPYRGFYTLCFGEAPVLAVFPSSFIAGLVAQLALIAIFLYSTGIFGKRLELFWYVIYSIFIGGGSLVLVSFENPGILFIASIGISGAIVLGLLINEYRLGLQVAEGLR